MTTVSASSATNDPWLDRVLGGRYFLVAAIGRGGMGVVYRACDHVEKCYVVVKMPRADLLSQDRFRDRFSHELDVVRGLVHPAIVPIVDVGEAPLDSAKPQVGMPYAVMPYLAGGSLSRRQQKREGGEAGTLWRWLPRIAEALDYVHRKGLVHRDVKPENILFDGVGDSYLSDFGIAKIVLQADAETRGLTKTGLSIGTPEYMAPELVAGARPDGRVDQYALAVTIFEVLAGRKPFVANNPAAILVQQATTPAPRLDSIRGDVPASLVNAIERALAKKPESRFSSCEAFAHALLADVARPRERERLRLLCPGCSALIKVQSSWAGHGGYCPKCKSRLFVNADLRSLWLESDRPRMSVVGNRSQRGTRRDAPGWLPRHDAAVGAVVGLAALVFLFLTVYGRLSKPPDVRALIRVDRDDQEVFEQLAATQEELRQLREQLDQAPVAAPAKTDEVPSRDEESPQALQAPQRMKNSVEIEFVAIPAGVFTMGQVGGEVDETPHRVTISNSFYMGIKEVTNSQWKKVMDFIPSKWQDDDRPVEKVSWSDAASFCRKLSDKEAERQAGRIYRLPTEAEWEYACRAGTQTKYSFGDNAEVVEGFAWFIGNSGDETHPVGHKKPNPWGLYDMHGNVWEWCSDWDRGYDNKDAKDPLGPPEGENRIIRGGSWCDRADKTMSAARGRVNPKTSSDNLGFRVVLSLTAESSREAMATGARPVKGPPSAIQEIEGQWEEQANGSHIHVYLGDRIGLLDIKNGTWQYGKVESQSAGRVSYKMDNQAVIDCTPIGPSESGALPDASREMEIKVFNPGGSELRYVKVLKQTKTKEEIQQDFQRGFPP